jgi:hypothetical protein
MTAGVPSVISTDIAFSCKECKYIIARQNMARFVTPTTPGKVAILFGHPDNGNGCLSGQERIYEEWVTGKLLKYLSHKAFYLFDFLGNADWWDRPIHIITLVDATPVGIDLNTRHQEVDFDGVGVHGELTLPTPPADEEPYGVDIWITITDDDDWVKISGFVTGPIWLKEIKHHVMACYCGDVGWLVSSGDYLTSEPV